MKENSGVYSFLRARLAGILLFFPGVFILGLARSLTPDPAGIGTHQQLGLMECGFITMFNMPCPMCGMTTTFTHLAHFQFWEGFVNQPYGTFLFFLNIYTIYIGFLELISPNKRHVAFIRMLEKREMWTMVILGGGLILSWFYKISIYNF